MIIKNYIKNLTGEDLPVDTLIEGIALSKDKEKLIEGKDLWDTVGIRGMKEIPEQYTFIDQDLLESFGEGLEHYFGVEDYTSQDLGYIDYYDLFNAMLHEARYTEGDILYKNYILEELVLIHEELGENDWDITDLYVGYADPKLKNLTPQQRKAIKCD